jgi:hypothetical protein
MGTGTSLSCDTATADGEKDIVLTLRTGDEERPPGFEDVLAELEILIQIHTVYLDGTCALTEKYAGYRALAPAGSNTEIPDHDSPPALQIDAGRLLRTVRMIRSGVDFDVLRELAAERSIGKHAMDGALEWLGGLALDEFIEGELLETTRETGVMVVHLVLGLPPGDGHAGCVDDDDEITCLLRGSIGGLELAADDGSDPGGNATEGLTLCVDYIPGTLGGRGCNKCSLHECVPSLSVLAE